MRSLFVCLLLLAGCASQKVAEKKMGVEDPVLLHVQSAYESLSKGRAKAAVAELDKALTICDERWASTEQKVYAARDLKESMYYLVSAEQENSDAVVVNSDCSDAYFLKGYATLELGDYENAERFVRQAVELSPANANYLAELGHIHHVKRDWENALEIFETAEWAAETFSPDEVKARELSRAKRGVGYSLIELGRIDEAEKKFQECLLLDREDAGAKSELEYIKKIRAGE